MYSDCRNIPFLQEIGVLESNAFIRTKCSQTVHAAVFKKSTQKFYRRTCAKAAFLNFT